MRYLLYRRLWAPGPIRTVAGNLATTGTRSPGHPAGSKLLYRLSYPDPGNCCMDYINSLIPAVFPPRKFSLPIRSNETLIHNLKAYCGKLVGLSSAYLQKHITGWDTKWGIQKGEMSLFRKYSKQQAPDPTMLFTTSTTERYQSICKDHTRNTYKESFQINWKAFSRTCFPPYSKGEDIKNEGKYKPSRNLYNEQWLTWSSD
jgi:hypothetical protein